MHDLRLTKTHIANLLLSLVAFGLFFSNQVNVFAGEQLDLHEQTGAYLLAGFLAVGVLVQMGKFIEGHQHWLQLLWTIIFLVVHIAAEIFIWVRTQITLLGIPDTLPLWIVGLYAWGTGGWPAPAPACAGGVAVVLNSVGWWRLSASKSTFPLRSKSSDSSRSAAETTSHASARSATWCSGRDASS